MDKQLRNIEKLATETVKCGLNGTSTAESFNREKFAELLIKECCSIVMADKVISWADSIRICDNIKEEFGIE